MNQIIYGNHVELYSVFNNLSILFCLIIGIAFSNRIYLKSALPKAVKEDNTKSKIATRLIAFFTLVISYYVIYMIDQALMPVISKIFLNIECDNYFAVLLASPIIAFVEVFVVKISLDFFEDIIALFSSTSLVLFKIACTCAGCCYGVAYSGRFYNDYLDEYQVPVQMIELACAAVMLVVLLILFKKNKMTGKLYPLFMLMYSGSRFISEFWRGDFPPVLGRMTGYHILCIIGFALGAIYMIIAVVYGKIINSFFEKHSKIFANKWSKKISAYKLANPNYKKDILTGIFVLIPEVVLYLLLVNIIFEKMRYEPMFISFFRTIGIESLGVALSFVISSFFAFAISLIVFRKKVFDTDTKSFINIVIIILAFLLSVWIGPALSAYAVRSGFVGVGADIVVNALTMIVASVFICIVRKYVMKK